MTTPAFRSALKLPANIKSDGIGSTKLTPLYIGRPEKYDGDRTIRLTDITPYPKIFAQV